MPKSFIAALALIACCAGSSAYAQSPDYSDGSGRRPSADPRHAWSLTNPITSGLDSDGYAAAGTHGADRDAQTYLRRLPIRSRAKSNWNLKPTSGGEPQSSPREFRLCGKWENMHAYRDSRISGARRQRHAGRRPGAATMDDEIQQEEAPGSAIEMDIGRGSVVIGRQRT